MGPVSMGVLAAKETPSGQTLDSACDSHRVCVCMYVLGADVQVEVDQDAYPRCHSYRSKPHDKTQCLPACARVLLWDSLEMGSQLPRCGHTSPKVGTALVANPTALLPELFAIDLVEEVKLLVGSRSHLWPRAPLRGGQSRLCPKDHGGGV